MKQPTFAIAVTFHLKQDCVDAFLKRVLQQARDSLRHEEGCRQFDVLVDEQDRSVVFLYEAYDDADAFEVHRSTEYFADFGKTVADWVESKDVRRLKLLENLP